MDKKERIAQIFDQTMIGVYIILLFAWVTMLAIVICSDFSNYYSSEAVIAFLIVNWLFAIVNIVEGARVFELNKKEIFNWSVIVLFFTILWTIPAGCEYKVLKSNTSSGIVTGFSWGGDIDIEAAYDDDGTIRYRKTESIHCSGEGKDIEYEKPVLRENERTGVRLERYFVNIDSEKYMISKEDWLRLKENQGIEFEYCMKDHYIKKVY